MKLLGKQLLVTHKWYDDYKKSDKIYRVLRRINRETKTQFISDVQRVPKSWRSEEGLNSMINFQKIARRFRKSKLIVDNKFTDYYGQISLCNSSDPMLSDTLFSDMFVVVDSTVDDLHMYDWERRQNYYFGLISYDRIKEKVFKRLGKEMDRPKHPCCLDTETYVSKYLGQEFNKPVYYVDRMYDTVEKEHWSHELDPTNMYDRNFIFHQVTSSGGDKSVITSEENEPNDSIGFWVFSDRIVYVKQSGCSER